MAGIGDDSAPRETYRQLQLLNERILQLITLQQMNVHGCDIPKKASSEIEYLFPAMKCRGILIEGGSEYSPECDSSKWKSSFENAEHFK